MFLMMTFLSSHIVMKNRLHLLALGGEGQVPFDRRLWGARDVPCNHNCQVVLL